MKTLTKQFVTIASVLFFIGGCSPKTAEERIAMAEEHLSKGETDAAVIELKNAVSTNLTDPLSRFMLAKIYIKQGDLPSAVKELLKSKELGQNENDVLPLLAISYYHMEEFEAASEVYFNSMMSLNEKSNSTLALYGYISSLRDSVEGNDIQLAGISPVLSEQELLIASAVEKIEQKNNQAAIELLNQHQSDDNLPLAYSLKGLAYFYDEQMQESIDSLMKVKELMPVINSSSYLLVNAFIKQENFFEAKKYVDQILKASPENTAANVIKAKAEYGLKNYEAAILAAEKAIQNGSKSVTARTIAGVSNFNIGKKEQAYTHLNAVYTRNELPIELSRLLAELQIELGYSDQAKKLLSGVVSSSKDDANYFAEIGLEFAKEGDAEGASNLLGKASKADPENLNIKLQKAVIDMSVEPKKSSEAFEDIIRVDPTLDIGWVYLAISKLENESLDNALSVATEWKLTNEADGSVLEGILYDRSGNSDKAEAAYLHALSIEESHSGANIYLSYLYDKSDRKQLAFDTATRAVLSGATQRQLSPLILRLGVETKQHVRSVETFKSLYESNMRDANTVVAYGAALRLAGEVQLAADLLANNVDMLNGFGFVTLGDAYIDLRQYEKALNAFQMWRENIPADPGGYLRAIGLMMLEGQLTPAMNLTDKAESRFPDEVRFKYLKLQQLTYAKRFAQAKDYLSSLKQLGENSYILLKLEADLAFADGKYALAESLRTKVLSNQNSFNNLYDLASALEKQSKNKEAALLLEKGLKDKTIGNSQRIKLAALYAEIEEYTKAEEQYLKLLEFNSQNLVWLNNLANVQINLNNLDSAVKNAEAAEKLAVGNSAIFRPYVDATLAKLLHLQGDYSKAYEKFESAIIALPNDTQLKFDYMETLIALNFYDKFDDVSRSVKPLNESEQNTLDQLRKRRTK